MGRMPRRRPIDQLHRHGSQSCILREQRNGLQYNSPREKRLRFDYKKPHWLAALTEAGPR